MTRRTILPLLVILLQLPLLPTAAAEAASATGPDADGVWLLAYDVPAGAWRGTLAVTREDADGQLAGARDLGTLTFSAPTRYQVSFLPAEGAGTYTVELRLDGGRVDEVRFEVDDASAQRTAEFHVPDAPTYLNLTVDDVNSDGKTKSPGDAVITRATVSDANGLADLDGVVFRVERAGALVDSGAVPLSGGASATSAPIELRYDRAPIAAGEHTLRLRAIKNDSIVAEAARTFIIRDVAATFVSASLPDALPDEDVAIQGTAVLADKNGAVGPGALELRVYRGSTRVEGAGFSATLGEPQRLADENGSARWSYPLEARVPARATPGAHRVSLYLNDTLLGSAPFEVNPLPTLRAVDVNTTGGRLVLVVNASGEGTLTARLTDGDGASSIVSSPIAATNITALTLDPPRRGVALAWSVTMRVRTSGPVLAERNGTWTPPLDGPALNVTALHARGRLPATWTLDAGGWNASAASANMTFTRWDGHAEPALRGAKDGARIRVDAPASLPAGRYTGHIVLTWPNGSAAEATWSFDAGPWMQLALGEPAVSGRNATLALENVGGLSVSRLVVESQPTASLALRVGNSTIAPQHANGRAHFRGFTLAPGEAGELRVALPEGPLAAGKHAVTVRVLARLEVS